MCSNQDELFPQLKGKEPPFLSGSVWIHVFLPLYNIWNWLKSSSPEPFLKPAFIHIIRNIKKSGWLLRGNISIWKGLCPVRLLPLHMSSSAAKEVKPGLLTILPPFPSINEPHRGSSRSNTVSSKAFMLPFTSFSPNSMNVPLDVMMSFNVTLIKNQMELDV